MASMPTHTNTLAYAPLQNAASNSINDAGDFVPWDARIGDSRPRAFDDERIAVAYAARLHLNANLSYTRLGNLTLDDFEKAFRSCHLRGFHRRHCYSSRHKNLLILADQAA